MRFKVAAFDDCKQWHPWFAWYPVRTLGGDVFFWETIERKWEYSMYGSSWHYRALDERTL